MKILAFGDPHGDMASLQLAKQRAEQADIVICLGDITWFGEDLKELLEFINTFPKPVYTIHGNHEFIENMQEICKSLNNITVLHKQTLQIQNYTFAFYGGDGFSRRDPEFDSWAEHLPTRNLILVTHGPPKDTLLDIPFDDYHSGSMSYRECIEKKTPLLALSGHIHECEKVVDNIDATTLFNPGPDGEIIDLATLSNP